MRAPSAPAALPAPPAVGPAVPRWRPAAADDVSQRIMAGQAGHVAGFHAILIPDAAQTRACSDFAQLLLHHTELLLAPGKLMRRFLLGEPLRRKGDCRPSKLNMPDCADSNGHSRIAVDLSAWP